ncbi:membrane protein insertase YidC [Adlercreutzia sp. ZJ242]|uniref:membrane protein insertase YidC n=1 Tax=Adlercreutzia sp. ZJ242 TaxID=2709409 RepID=UPI001F1503D5|nr:membrane protein insertase YidC [Adlercreutzia sp. ZJ242]
MLVMQPCYDLTGNWWAAILIFTLITKVILFPMSLWCQWNSIVMVKLMPELNRIKVKYFGDRETIGEKQSALYKEKHYHPMLSLVPLAVQIIILFGLVDVIHFITDNGAPGTEFLGMVPSVDGGVSWVMPLLAGLSAVAMGFAQNRINPLQREQSRAEKNMTNGLSIGLSLFLGVFVAAGMCFYWIISNLSAILIQALCNIAIKPRKHIDYADLEASRVELEDLNSLDGGKTKKWYQRDPLAKREKQDYKRFFKVINKHVVFYSEGSGFYKYFEGPLTYLLDHSVGDVHYVTNDPNDQIFEIAEKQPRIRPYYIGQKRAITLMMKMDADIVVATLEDLDNYYIKRSYVRDDTEYVFFFHHMTSTHLVARREALDHYDTIMCAGPHQVKEIRRAESLRALPEKNLVEYGYALLDHEIESFGQLKEANERPVILIAPSWQEDCILDLCIDRMLESMLGRGWRIIVRPHPEYTKRYKARWQALISRYESVSEDELYFERDFSSNRTIFTSDIIITDWSSVACEFSFSTCKPSIFIDTPMKVCNPDYEELGMEPTDISLRNQIGISLAPEECGVLGDKVEAMLADAPRWGDEIRAVREGFIYNVGRSGEVAGEYLLGRILEKQGERVEGGACE